MIKEDIQQFRKYSPAELETMLKEAYSLESMEKNSETSFVGTVRKGRRLFDLMIDKEKHYWYTVRIDTGKEIVSEFEAVFGCTEKEMKMRRKTFGRK